ncbi:hypothetical protein JYU34_003474 [Plutella xylostella]|uniref:Uncharacterized protein n=1 Tax=Plutella xylostella TaxID=51655 RepID=A0ABQ7R056_PLUXY|nr:hypothetical protein JYU34_003474 [Plutella xylostella]
MMSHEMRVRWWRRAELPAGCSTDELSAATGAARSLAWLKFPATRNTSFCLQHLYYHNSAM